MKKILIAVSAICFTIGFTACDDDFKEGFRQGWNSTAPSQYHYAPGQEEAGEPADAPEVVAPVEGAVNE